MTYSLNTLFLPTMFLFLYGSGFVFTSLGLESSTPIAFLSLRFFLACILLLIVAKILNVPWPKNIKEVFHIAFAGSMTVGVFSLGVFLSLSYGIEASLSALIIALQPILVTFLAAKLLEEELNKKIIIGLLLGIFGVTLVVSTKASSTQTEILGIVFSIVALLGLSIGNVYQKKYCSNMNLYSGGMIQTFASTLLALPFLLFFEVPSITLTPKFIVALFFMTVCVSIVALSILYILIKESDVSKVSSIFYLMPVMSAVMAYVVLDSEFDILILIGALFIFLSIYIINSKKS